ncbi:MAG: aminotransferase class I/II-fold pyridoxal phosphate-dependent enzyme [Candidatus Eutrophobiaceae bacterium]
MSSPIPCLEILERRRQEGLFRERRVISGYSGRWMEMDGRALIDFTRNDYLDISNHADLIDAFKQCTGKFGMGSGGSQFLGGYTSAHQRLEEELAEFLQRDRAILFSSGYLANLAAVSAMCKRNETVLADRFVHASLIDAARLAGVRLKRYAHCAPAALEAILTGEAAGKAALGSRLKSSAWRATSLPCGISGDF